MAGTFIEHVACTYEDCGSSDGMAVYSGDNGTHNGYCFVCNRFSSDPYNTKVAGVKATMVIGPAEQPQDNPKTYLESINEYPIVADLSRRILIHTSNYFGVKALVSEVDGVTLTKKFYPYTKGTSNQVVAYKVRSIPKEFVSVGDFKDVNLFGQPQAEASGSNRLYITEGEEDAMALFQSLKDHARGTQWERINPAVVSIPNGASSAVKSLSKQAAFLKKFKDIVLIFDQDIAGKEAVSDVLKLIPEALVVNLEEKDCSDMVVKGKWNNLAKSVLFNAKAVRPSAIVSVSDVLERALAKPVEGIPWPWPTLTASTHGIHRKKIYGLGAGVGMGKSEFAKQLQSHLVTIPGTTGLGIFSFEEDVARTIKGIAGKIDGIPYHIPDVEYSEQKLRNTIQTFQDKVILFDHFGTKDWTDVKAAIRFMVVAEGIKDIFLDPLTALVSHLSSSEANDALNTIMGDLAGMTHELDFSVYYFCHLNPPISGPPHERGGKVLEQQFTGSRAMMRWTHYLFGLEGNKDPELPDLERNTRYISVLKDREYGNAIRFPVHYNRQDGRLLEPTIGAY